MYNGYPEVIIVEGEEYEVNTDFRVWCEIDELLFGAKLTDERCAHILGLCYRKKLPANPEAAFLKACEFYNLNRYEKKRRKKTESKKRIISFVHDEQYITAAFLSEYNIDLNHVQMHWFRFRTLFDGLSDEQKISEILKARAVDISKIKDKQLKAYYKKMKRDYKLPDGRTPEEKEADMVDVLSRVIGV